uniref:COesterase domain-containing protein n=1 Tax=Strongyloides papillosus TaxID=174720 RepID=A0A0N5C9Q8_STREA
MVEFNQNETAELFMIYNSIKATKPREKVAQLFSDVIINCECSLFLDSYLDTTNKNVYLFEFRRRSTVNPSPKWMGISHGSELYYFFGHPFRYPYKYDRKDLQFEKKFSEKLMEDLGEFVATGKPKTNWKKFTKASKKAFIIDDFYCKKNHKKYVLATSKRCVKFNQLMEHRELSYKRNFFLNEGNEQIDNIT